ncbi:hypothetical protein COEREDRAFT_81262 [Coemansia reversa NRRL 1564]|uniref:Uncharacterized protein n=1 Tax=Coemansia reversa (strain ATCC 12441 / NRRL 1564) TaxID=763665 RepID=A0A2G5BB88_COERN|nr:hypothetical protein COEREDRAFT_81262 [Coemansia reversa NRRL 1564]|eukprot:PIA16276.1 hypothetical protein COEREDRAFT_81262 [Coemansia reversa NRRL 1564]
MSTDKQGSRQTAFVAQALQQPGHQTAMTQNVTMPSSQGDSTRPPLSTDIVTEARGFKIASIIKLGIFTWALRWVIRYFEIDRSLRQEQDTPQISQGWLFLALCSLIPFVFVYVYASVWRRRVLGEPLNLQDWRASSSSLVHAATIGLLLAWSFAIIALFPGHGLSSFVIVVFFTICWVAIVDAIEGIF